LGRSFWIILIDPEGILKILENMHLSSVRSPTKTCFGEQEDLKAGL